MTQITIKIQLRNKNWRQPEIIVLWKRRFSEEGVWRKFEMVWTCTETTRYLIMMTKANVMKMWKTKTHAMSWQFAKSISCNAAYELRKCESRDVFWFFVEEIRKSIVGFIWEFQVAKQLISKHRAGNILLACSVNECLHWSKFALHCEAAVVDFIHGINYENANKEGSTPIEYNEQISCVFL